MNNSNSCEKIKYFIVDDKSEETKEVSNAKSKELTV